MSSIDTTSPNNQCTTLFRTGTILNYQDDFQNLKIRMVIDGENEDFEHVPFHYNCQSAYPTDHPETAPEVFAIGDQVLVECDEEEQPKLVVGFPSNARPCATAGLMRMTEYPIQLETYGPVTLEVWINNQHCHELGNPTQLNVNIRQTLRNLLSDNVGQWVLTDFRFARDYPWQLVVLCERFFTTAQMTGLPAAQEYRESRIDKYIYLIYNITKEFEIYMHEWGVIEPGSRRCDGKCSATGDKDFESNKDCPGFINKCSEDSDSGCMPTAVTNIGAGCSIGCTQPAGCRTPFGVNDYNGEVTGSCTRTCSASCASSPCCYNCMLSMAIYRVYLVKDGIPKFYGVQGTSTHARVRADSWRTEYLWSGHTRVEYTGPDAPGCTTSRNDNDESYTEFSYSPGGSDDHCEACCSSEVHSYGRHWTVDDYSSAECSPFEEAQSVSYTRADYDESGPSEFLTDAACVDGLYNTAARLVIGEPDNFSCTNYPGIFAAKTRLMGSFEYAAGAHLERNIIAPWKYECCCNCAGAARLSDYCGIQHSSGGNFSWNASFSIYDVLDEDQYFYKEQEYYTCFSCDEIETIENTDVLLNTLPFELEGAYEPVQSLPQSIEYGVGLVSQKVTANPRFQSYTSAYNGAGIVPVEVRCKEGMSCYYIDYVFDEGALEYSLLIHNLKVGFEIFRDKTSESLLGTWWIKLFPYMREYIPTLEDYAAPAFKYKVGVKYVSFDENNPMVKIELENIPYLYQQKARVCVYDYK